MTMRAQLRSTCVIAIAIVACDRAESASPSDAQPQALQANDAAGTSAAVTGPPQQPPTQASCEANAPQPGCHWTLVPSSYCGGPPPPAELTWPHCSCEVCATDEHCGAGERCVLLATDDECHPAVHVCVAQGKTCTPESGCHPDEQCMAVEGRPRCKIPTNYPPRP